MVRLTDHLYMTVVVDWEVNSQIRSLYFMFEISLQLNASET